MTGLKRFATMHVRMNRVYCAICDQKMSLKHDVCYDRQTKQLVCTECAAMIEADPRATAQVSSSHGAFIINRFTGEVISRELDDCGDCKHYHSFTRFNIKECCKWWGIRPADAYDILDLGYWYDSGKYEKPDIDWRRMVRTLDIPEEIITKHPTN